MEEKTITLGGCGCGQQHFEKATEALKEDHQVIERVLGALQKLMQNPEATSLNVWKKAVDFIGNFADKCHHLKEEKILFPALEERGMPRHGGPIGMMLLEHEQGRAYVRGMVKALEFAKEDPEAATPTLFENAAAYSRLLRQHINKENEILFEMADAALAPEEQKALLRAFEEHEAREMGPGVHQKYLKIAEALEKGEFMEATHTNGGLKAKEINLLERAHAECHETVIRGLDGIGPGDSALVIADHDAQPVLYQYQAERGQSLNWEYKEEGPEIWKILVTKGKGAETAQPLALEEFDVRSMPPPLRHKTIFEKFDGLHSGEGFVLINDHDPKPLYYELRSVRGEVLEWDYLEKGPKVWRVKLLKTKDVEIGADKAKLKFDVRKIPPPDRHPSIFHRFGTLTAGESIEIFNDHDPRPLYFHFQQLYGSAFSWEYLEQGPALWRVRITKEGNRVGGKRAETDRELDVRPFPPAERHRLIFENYEQLKRGESFVLVNDHDPKPLYYQFAAEHSGEFTWDYLEKGPQAWRVRIGKEGLPR